MKTWKSFQALKDSKLCQKVIDSLIQTLHLDNLHYFKVPVDRCKKNKNLLLKRQPPEMQRVGEISNSQWDWLYKKYKWNVKKNYHTDINKSWASYNRIISTNNKSNRSTLNGQSKVNVISVYYSPSGSCSVRKNSISLCQQKFICKFPVVLHRWWI